MQELCTLLPGYETGTLASACTGNQIIESLGQKVDSLIDMRSQEKNRLGTAHESVTFD